MKLQLHGSCTWAADVDAPDCGSHRRMLVAATLGARAIVTSAVVLAMPQIKRTREENIAVFGGNNACEALGLKLVRDAIERDGRLTFLKSAEGARADFCVHLPGDDAHALGVQLKTTRSLQRVGNWDRFIFQKTSGYHEFHLLLIGLTDPPRAWLLNGSDVSEKDIHIPAHATTTSKWAAAEIDVEQLAQNLWAAFSHSTNTCAASILHAPTAGTSRRREYDAHGWLRRHLHVDFEEPAVEQSSWDYEVSGARWQMKLASYVPKTDQFRVGLCKSSGGSTKQQYGREDFDYLAIQLPFEHAILRVTPPHMYLIPMEVLFSRGLVGGSTSCACVTVYPHRALGLRHWTREFLVDLRDPTSALTYCIGLTSE